MNSLVSAVRPPRQPWQERAMCAGEIGALFYPPLRTEKKVARLRREARAIAVCHGCPVREHCLADALLNNERYGIWGGLTGPQRLALAAESPIG